MASARIGLIAKQAAFQIKGEGSGALNIDASFGAAETHVDNVPEFFPLPLPVRLAPFRRRAKRAQMNVVDVCLCQSCRQLAFRKSGFA